MLVRFWGVRGSSPAPVSNADIAARIQSVLLELGRTDSPPDLSDPAAISQWIKSLPPQLACTIGGNTPCIEMRTSAGDIFIIDLGSGIRPLGHSLMTEAFGKGEGHANIFLSHFHWDHIQGWPFFRPAYVPGNTFDLYCRHESPRERLKSQQMPPFFPGASWDEMRAEVNYHCIDEQPLTICEGRVRVTSLELDHPSKAYAYRFETENHSFVYASDGAYYNLGPEDMQPYVDFYRDADLLVFDAQFALTESFEKRTWGHSSAIVGVELACMAGVKSLALFHHDPSADDALLEHFLRVAEQYSRTIPCESRCKVFLAREGLSIDL